MALKIPPPPVFAGPQWQSFNRWLLEVTSILGNTGGIDPDQVTGLPALFTEVATQQTEIAALQGTTGGQGSAIGAINLQLAIILGDIATINGQITSLEANAVVRSGATSGVPSAGIGVNGDWFADTSGHHIYVKIAGTYVQVV